MSVLGTLLKTAGQETDLVWYLPNVTGPQALTLTSEAFGDGEVIPVEHAAKRAGRRILSRQLALSPPHWRVVVELLLVAGHADAPTRQPFAHCMALVEPLTRNLSSGAFAFQNRASGARRSIRLRTGKPTPAGRRRRHPRRLRETAPGAICRPPTGRPWPRAATEKGLVQ